MTTWRERFDASFEQREFCSCYDGDINDAWPTAKDKLLNFINSERRKAVEEALEMVEPYGCAYNGCGTDGFWEEKKAEILKKFE